MKSNSNSLNKVSIASLLITLGIIYGDIGTSPLYVLKAIVGERHISTDLVLGGVSCIIWTLTFQTTIKYIWLTLKADNNGEGGIFSLYALVRKYSKYVAIPTILGATTLLADGIITPPISVMSAVEGLTIVFPQTPIIPIVIIILSLLFFFQRFGTKSVGSAFGPIMIIWFSMLFVIGVSQIIRYPSVLMAVNPYYAINLLLNFPHGFWLLGAVFLATTGAEALYSDLGHCGRKNIRITWVFVKTTLITNYLGQSAWLLYQRETVLNGRNPFYEMMPQWFIIPGIIIATSAAIIASQALISGSYTLINEAINLNFWPRVAVRQPTELKGQIYIPSVNIILWAGCILMVIYFRSSTHMEAAYGFSIVIAMMMTTFLMTYYLKYNRRWKLFWVIGFISTYIFIESCFFITNVAKIKERWMFLFFELFIFSVMYIWFNARKINNKLTRFVDFGKFIPSIIELSMDKSIPKFSTHLIYLTKANRRNEIEQKIINSIFSKKPKRAHVYWFIHIHRSDEPYTLSYSVSELFENKIFKITISTGFRVQARTELYFKRIIQDLIHENKIHLNVLSDEANKYNTEIDFRFIVFEKFLSIENEFSIRQGIILNCYLFLKHWAQSDAKAFGLDRSAVEVEEVPLIYKPVKNINLVRTSELNL
jgi:KUP system potassium uptake protein